MHSWSPSKDPNMLRMLLREHSEVVRGNIKVCRCRPHKKEKINDKNFTFLSWAAFQCKKRCSQAQNETCNTEHCEGAALIFILHNREVMHTSELWRRQKMGKEHFHVILLVFLGIDRTGIHSHPPPPAGYLPRPYLLKKELKNGRKGQVCIRISTYLHFYILYTGGTSASTDLTHH